MNRTAVKNYAIRARRTFRQIVAERANALGISGDGIARAESAADMIVINGRPFPKSIEMTRRELVERVRHEGFDAVIEQVAYTLFNRFCALRFMGVNGYLSYPVLSSAADDDTPDILKHAMEAADALVSDGKQKTEIRNLKLCGDQDQKLYSMLILAQCNALAKAMPFLFEKPNDVTELLMPENLLHSDSVVRNLVESIDEDDWREIEIVGWLYQFYISEKKDEVIGKVVKKEDIPAATQLFTPKWIVQYMVENSLGRLWMQSHPDSRLREQMEYYIDNSAAAPLSSDDTLTVDTPDEITCMDPCCGSGHILVYMFDLLYVMYEETGYIQRDIPRMILENNLHGLDIDQRAAQLAGFALTMKARAKDPRFLEQAIQPHVMAIVESNDIDLRADEKTQGRPTRSPFDATDTLFTDNSLLPDQNQQPPSPLQAFAPLVQLFQDAKNYGSLLRLPDNLSARLDKLKIQLNALRGGDTLFTSSVLPKLNQLIKQARLLSGQYHVVITNPPYMGGKGMNKTLKDFAKEQFSDSKSDLFAMFIERNLDYTKKRGFSAMITMQSWMFLSSYEKLRAKILNNETIISMAHMGARGFDSISGEVVQTTAFVLSHVHQPEYKGSYLRLVEGKSEAEKAKMMREAIQ